MAAPRPDPTPTAAPAAERPFRVRLRLDFGGTGARLGPGKIDLLEAVGRTGSISAAGRAMGMSYRRAWLLVDAVNQMFDEPVVIAAAGGPHGGGAVLTPFGMALVRAFRALEEETTAATTETLGAFFAHLARPGPARD
jgi:molybdate transport system regulatory protein